VIGGKNGLKKDACVGEDTSGAIKAAMAGKKPKTTAKVKVSKKQEPSVVSGKMAAVGDSLTVGVAAGNKSYIDILGGKKFAIGGKASFQLLGQAEIAIASGTGVEMLEEEINILPEPLELSKVFKLNPPSHGLKSTKIHYPKGDLAYRGEKINDLLKRMI